MQRCLLGVLLAGVCVLSVGCGEQSNMARVTGTVSRSWPIRKFCIRNCFARQPLRPQLEPMVGTRTTAQ